MLDFLIRHQSAPLLLKRDNCLQNEGGNRYVIEHGLKYFLVRHIRHNHHFVPFGGGGGDWKDDYKR